MTRDTRWLIVLGGVVSLAVPPAAVRANRQAASIPAITAAPAGDLAARLATHLPVLMDQAIVPGAQVAAIEDGTVAWQGAFGVANAETRVPVTGASVFEAASLTKPLFAYAVLTLVDEGRLDLDRPLVAYLPGRYDVENDDRVTLVTARHVLSHRTGFPNWRPGRQAPLPIHFTPGERFSYSGEGFVYLGAVVERITGETVEAFVKRRVLDPLGMSSSSLVWQERYETLKVHGHDLLGQVAGRGTPWRANAAASLHTTARDYATFVAAVLAGSGLAPATLREMLSPQVRLDDAGFNTATVAPTGRHASSLAWGLGWGLEQDGDVWSVWHWGDNGATKAYVTASPSRRSGLVVFLNSENGLTIVPDLVADARGEPGAAFAWIRVQKVVPAFHQLVTTMRERGIVGALEEYRAARRLRPDEAPLSENTVNSLGYSLLRQKRTADAIAVFEQNVQAHPDSWNVHDSLGEALAAAGETQRAIEAYERSLVLNPGNRGGTEALARLRAAATKG